jgi:dTDP-4-dehydrorhamnose 3,5-epimerase
VQIRELSIPDAYEITPKQFGDDRGVFLEWYRFDKLEEATGRSIDLPRGQAKYVTVTHGAVLDYVVDIRVGSPTFGQWDSVLLDTTDRRAIFLSEGLGHAFVALTDDATVSYLVTDVFNAPREHGINPIDPEIGLVFPSEAGEALLSPKDTDAPGLREAAEACLLPTWDEARAFYGSLTKAGS